MEKELVLKELGELKTALEEQVKKATEPLEKEIKELKEKQPEVKAADITELKEANVELQKSVDIMNLNAKEAKATVKEITFGDALKAAIVKQAEDIKNYNSNGRKSINIDLKGVVIEQTKTVGNMAAANLTTSGTETFAGNTFLGIGRKPYDPMHVRNIPGVSVVPIATDSAYVIRDAAGEGGPTAVGMGVVKPQSDRDYVKLIQPVTKIAHYFKIPEEMLADNAWMTNEITNIGVEELLVKEDSLLLTQAAGAGLFAGLTTATNSTAYASPASLALAIDNANNYDVLVAAWTQLKALNTTANAILVNPADYAKMILTKDTTGSYVFGAPNVSIPNVFGIPLIPYNAITSDKFLIGDFSKVRIGQREGVSVRFYDQNEDDAIKNMVTVVIEERLTVVVDRADRLVYGDFSDARTALETA